MSEHALLSASAAERWLRCPPSVRLTEHLPDKDSEFSAKGTLAHAIAELKLQKYATPMSARAYNAALKKLQSDPLYEQAMMANTDLYLEHIKGIVTGYPPTQRPNMHIERRVQYGHVAPEGFGTADCIVVGAGALHIIDYKNGAGVRVEVHDNPQLKLYALGALREFGLLHTIERVHLHIVQPNNGGISSWSTTPAELNAWADEIRPAAQAAFDGEGECSAGEWCRFCKVFVSCPAQRQNFSLFEDLTKARPDPAELPPDEIGDLLARVPVVAEWMNKLREFALAQILAGAEIPGWKSVEGRSNRAWTDQEGAFRALVAGGIDEALLYERKPLTLTAVETAIGKKTFAELAAAFVKRPAGAPTLAPEADKRPAFTGRTPEQVFKNVEGSLL